jgi:hypothetical protein
VKTTNLFVANLFWVRGTGPLHGHETQDLQQVVLHNVANDTKFVKVATSSFRSNLLFERDLHVVDIIAVPKGREEYVGEPQVNQVLDHLLA